MSKFEKLKLKIKNGQSISYEEAETCLLKLGFIVRSKGSHHVFAKDGYCKNISIKKCPRLLTYQMNLIAEAIEAMEKNEAIEINEE